MKKCFLAGHGDCGGKISGEHYISETVLQAIGVDGLQIGGMPWQPKQTLQKVGAQSLVSNVLCETHNSALSELDNAAGQLFRAIDAADKRPTTLPPISTFSGPLIERWFLKVICGLAAGAGFNNSTVPAAWRSALSGEPWPAAWGMYLLTPAGTHVLATEFSVETLVNPQTNEVKAVNFRVAGVHFSLALGRPDNPTAWGTHRPRRLIFRDGQVEKRIEFDWPFDTEQAVIFTKVGNTKARPPQWHEWQE